MKASDHGLRGRTTSHSQSIPPEHQTSVRRLMKILFDAVVLGFLAFSPLAAQDETGTPFLRNYSRKEYSAASSNWAILQDKRGLMYFGTDDCILEYDGVTWRKIHTAGHTRVRSLAIDPSGRIYVGAVGEFGYLATDSLGQLYYVSLLDKVPPEDRTVSDVWKTHVVPAGVFFQTFSHLFFYDPNTEEMKTWRTPTLFHRAFAVDDQLYVQQIDRGLFVMQSDSLHLVPGGSVFSKTRIYSMLRYDENRTLIATVEKGLYLMTGNSIVPFPAPVNDFLIRYQVYCGTRLHNGNFVFGTLFGGAVIMDSDGEIVRIMDKSAGLQDQAAQFVFQDSEEGLWLALDDGISRFEVTLPLTLFGESAGLEGAVTAVYRYSGKLYVGTGVGVFCMKTTGSWRPAFKQVDGIRGESWEFWSDGTTLMVGTIDGVYRIEGDQAELVQRWRHALCFHRSRRDPAVLYVGLESGVGLLTKTNGRWHGAGKIQGISDVVQTMEEDTEGSLWIGTEATGLIRATPRDGAGWTVERFGPPQGLPSGGINVFNIRNELVFSGRGGLFRFDQTSGRFEHDRSLDPLLGSDSTRVTRLIVEGSNGRVWMCNYAEGQWDHVAATRLEDGTYNVEWNALSRLRDFGTGALYVENDRVLWLGGVGELLHYDMLAAKKEVVPFKTAIRRVTVASDSVVFGGGGTGRHTILPYRLNSVRLEYAAPMFDDESATRYQYRLDGFSTDWSAWTTETWKDYSNLPPGKYVFRVHARNLRGTAAEEATFSFDIRSPWYMTWWAVLLYLGTLIFLVMAIVQYRSRRLEQEKKRLERLVEQRTEEIRKQNEELLVLHDKQQEFMGIAAHDLRSPLSGIIGLQTVMREDLDNNDVDVAIWKDNLHVMNDVATRMLVLIEDLLDISAIESGKLTLHFESVDLGLLAAECAKIHMRAAGQKQIELSVASVHDLPPVCADKRRIAEVVDNFLSNAIKYTYPGGRVRVYFDHSPKDVTVHIEDTGQGLTDEDLRQLFTGFKKLSAKPTGGESSVGLGLVIVKKIIQQHGGGIAVNSTRGKGSTFAFSLPRDANQAKK